MKKNTYHFKDNFSKNDQKIKKEMDEIINNYSDDDFYKKEAKIRNRYNEIVEINYYLEQVLNYIIENKMSFNDYYLMIASNYRDNRENPEFEKNNPFVKEKDIKALKESNDLNASSIFALELSKIVEDSLMKRMGN